MDYKAIDNRYTNGMQYRRCGSSGVMLPVLSLGLWHNFGAKDNQATAESMIYHAFDHGICHFDLANNYGPPPGSAEELFGEIYKKSLSKHRDELLISTKAGHLMWQGPYGDGGSRKYLLNSVDQSLKRMQLDYVDIFYSHRYDPDTPLEETLGTLVDIVRQGKALYVGISKYPPKEAAFAYEYLKQRDVKCLVNQDRYNILNRSTPHQVPATANEHGVGFVAFSPLAQGLLTDKYIHGIPQLSRAAKPEGFLKREQITVEVVDKIVRLKAISERRSQSLAEMSLAWVLNNSLVTSVIIGASSVEQLKLNLKSINNINFSSEELYLIDQIAL